MDKNENSALILALILLSSWSQEGLSTFLDRLVIMPMIKYLSKNDSLFVQISTFV